MAKSLINDGDILLDEYREKSHEVKNYGLLKKDGHLYNYFPLGTGLMAVPFVWLFEKLPNSIAMRVVGFNGDGDPQYAQRTAESWRLPLERAIASFYVALAAVFVFMVAKKTIDNIAYALVTAFIFAFCTPAWSTASRGLWQHGPGMFLLILAVYFLTRLQNRPICAAFAGISLAAAFVVRPTNAIVLLIFSIVFINKNKRLLLSYVLGILSLLVPFVAFSWNTYHSFLPPYYYAGRLHIGWYTIEAFFANLISPSRGLFVFSPLFIFCVVEIVRRAKAYKLKIEEVALVMIIISYLFIVSMFPHWWGGHCYGPRFLSEVSLLLCYFIPYVLESMRSASFLKNVSFLFCVCVSLLMHYQGANNPETTKWNTVPNDIDRHVYRVWDFYDPQFLR